MTISFNPATSVSAALDSRLSVRAFRPDPVPGALLRRIINQATRAPSGGNLQPWHFIACTGAPLKTLIDAVTARAATHPTGEASEYPIYPSPLNDPYKTRRTEIGEDMYACLGIPRDDRVARRAWFARNFQLFGAPVGLFCLIDRGMGPGQFSDLGMVLQSIMLLLREAGLDSCAQEAWAMFAPTIYQTLNTPPNLMLFCGMAIGYRDPDAPVNALRSTRALLNDVARFDGFAD